MDTKNVEDLFLRLSNIVDTHQYAQTNRMLLSRTVAITSLHFAAATRTLCRDDLVLGAAVALRSQFEALVRSVWIQHRATDTQVENLSSDLSPESQQANKNIPLVAEMLAELEKFPVLANLLISLKEFKGSTWQPLNSFVHSGIHAVHWTKWKPPQELTEQLFRSSNGLAVLAFQGLAVLTGIPSLQRDVISACEGFSSCLPVSRA